MKPAERILACITACLLLTVTSIAQDEPTKQTSANEDTSAVKQVEKETWQQNAEDALEGVWILDEDKKSVIPKLKISFNDGQLQIQFWGRGSTDEEPSDDASDLHVLARYADAEVDGETAVAFTTREADYGVMHFTLKLQDDVLAMDGIKIVKDPSVRVNRIISATYSLNGDQRGNDESNGKPNTASNGNNPAKVANDKKQDAKKPAKLGAVAGKIETGSTLRGLITLSPLPPKVRPTSGIEASGTNPQFSFVNVPEGEYTLTFQGTVNGETTTLSWKGLEIDSTGGTPKLSLSVRAAQ
jgi:hypothetical protein